MKEFALIMLSEHGSCKYVGSVEFFRSWLSIIKVERFSTYTWLVGMRFLLLSDCTILKNMTHLGAEITQCLF